MGPGCGVLAWAGLRGGHVRVPEGLRKGAVLSIQRDVSLTKQKPNNRNLGRQGRGGTGAGPVNMCGWPTPWVWLLCSSVSVWTGPPSLPRHLLSLE